MVNTDVSGSVGMDNDSEFDTSKFWRFHLDSGEVIDVEAKGANLPLHNAAWYAYKNRIGNGNVKSADLHIDGAIVYSNLVTVA